MEVEYPLDNESLTEEEVQQKELIGKFLEGKLSFADYVSLLEQAVQAEDDIDVQPDSLIGDVTDGPTGSKKAFERDLANSSRSQLRRQPVPGTGVRRFKLQSGLSGLMGEANIRFARKDFEWAKSMCMEIIRQAPLFPEPFQTLTYIYEELGDMQMALQVGLIAGFLNPTCYDWVKLAEMAMDLNDNKIAQLCYSRAIISNPANIDLHISRCNLLELATDKRGALKGYIRALSHVPSDNGPKYNHVTKEIARIYHELGDFTKARDVMLNAFEKHPTSITSEYVNLITELLLNLNEYSKCLELIQQYCGIIFMCKTETRGMNLLEQAKIAYACHTPDVLAIDLRVKLVITLIRLHLQNLVPELLIPLYQENPNEVGDLYVDVADAFMSQQNFRDAIPLLQALVASENFSLAAVWLRYGECLQNIGDIEKASDAYENVVKLAPQHYSARITLSSLLQKLGKPEEAIVTLTQDQDVEVLDSQMLYERCHLLLSENQEEEFIRTTKLLLSRHCLKIRTRDELSSLIRSHKLKTRSILIKEMREAASVDNEGPSFNDKTIPLEDEWELLLTLCEKFFKLQRYEELQNACFSAFGSRKFLKDETKAKELEFLCLLSCLYNNDTFHGYNIARMYVTNDINNNRLWNMFNILMLHSDDMRHNRFLMRLTVKNQTNITLGILNAHNCLIAGTYKYALSEYMTAFKQDPDNPMIALMLGICFTHLACQKFSAKKHALVAQACAFFNNYETLRGQCQETYYNMGRAMHQLSIYHAAVHYYKKALEYPPSVSDSEANIERFDLKREIAFNLSLIYKNSGNNDLAMLYTQKYIVI